MSYRRSFLIWLAQLLLLLGSLAATHFTSGEVQYGLNLTLALIMAGLTVAYFMRLNLADSIIRLFALGGVLWVAFLLLLTLTEWATRGGAA